MEQLGIIKGSVNEPTGVEDSVFTAGNIHLAENRYSRTRTYSQQLGGDKK